MKFKRFLPLVLLVLIFSGCQNNKVYYEDNFKFENNIWPRFNHVTFDVPINDANKHYDLLLTAYYDINIDFDELPIQVNTETEDGEKRFSEFHIKLKDSHGAHKGTINDKKDCMEIQHVIRKDFTVGKPGKLHVDIECFYPKYNIPYIKELKLQLVNAETSAK